MECGEGMVAVVRGLKDSALAVTLLDGGKHYTLQPDVPSTHVSNSASAQCSTDVVRRESAVQATDGRYASTYKMMHCHVIPTSPQTEVTEFPPQRAALCPGQGNFEIGGPGSCEKYRATKSNSYKGGLCWPDKGAVFASRPSVQPDAFANSLRKYSNMSPERSAEIMERLISYAQNRSVTSKTKSPSPTRVVESEPSTFCLEALRNASAKTRRSYERDINLRNRSINESPTRERSKRPGEAEVESWRRGTFCKTTDVRYLKDVTRAVKEGIRSMGNNNQPEKLPRHENPSPERRTHAQKSCNSVNMEIQAAVQMVSREVVTSPRVIPSQRNVGISITPTTSGTLRSPGGVLFRTSDIVNQSIQTLNETSVGIKTTLSTNDIRKRKRRTNRRSKSDEEIRLERNYGQGMENNSPRIDKLKNLRRNKCSCKSKNVKIKTTNFRRTNYNVHDVNSFDDIDCFNFNPYPGYSQVFHTKITPYRAIDEDDLAEVLEDWLNIIPIKPIDYFGRPIEREYLFYDLFERLKHTAYHLPDHNRRDKIKGDIIRLLNEFPVDVKGNRNVYLNKLADILIEKIKNLGRSVHHKRRSPTNNINSYYSFSMHRYIPPTESELRTFITDEIVTFIRKFGLPFSRQALLELEEELVDVVTVFMENIHTSNDDLIGGDIINILVEHGFLDHQASHFVHTLIKHLREAFLDDANVGRVKSETLVVLPSIQSPNPYTSVNTNNTDFSISAINESDLNALMETYTRQLCEQINEWLNSIQTLLPRINERGFRQVVVNDLAGDIIDRHKYLEMNPGSRGTDEAELEHLKYQIFKWINKLAGEDTLQPGEHAPELMRRIRSIPVPMLTMPNTGARVGNINGMKTIDPNLSIKNSTDRNNSIQSSGGSKVACSPPRACGKPSCSQNTKHGVCCPNESLVPPTSQSTEQLNDEYEEFLKNWVQKIPIQTSSPEEEALAEKARLGIHNGIWKAITKIRCDQSIFTNRFYFEDVFDDEIEDLLNCLPQTPELQAKKHLLKVELIKRTVDTLEHNKAELARSFRQELMRHIENSLQKQGLQLSNDSHAKAQEELEMMRILEQFILYSNYKNDDPVKSEVYKKRLLKEIKELIDEIKKNHGQDQTNINYAMHITDILNALHLVSLPSDDTIKEEANNILLEFEIEKWFTDLPITLNEDNNIEILQWKRKLDNLAQKIRDLEINTTSTDTRERSIKNEIVKFLERAPLQGENVNINFMAEQLVNRIKNRDQLNQSKRVAFHEPGSYDEFRSNVPLSSSYIESSRPTSGSGTQNEMQNSLALRNEGRSLSGTEVEYGAFAQERPKSSTFKEHDESNISYQGFSGRRPASSTFKDNDASDISYQGFSERRPASSTFKNKEEGYVSVPPTTSSHIRDSSIGEYRDFSDQVLKSSTFKDKTLGPIHSENQGRDMSDISYEGFSGKRPVSSTFKNRPDQSFGTQNESTGGHMSGVNYNKFDRSPISSTFRGDDEGFVTIPRYINDASKVEPTYHTIPETPRRSSSQSRRERSSDQFNTLRSTPKSSRKRSVDDGVQINGENMSRQVPVRNTPGIHNGTSSGVSPNGFQRLETPQPARFQKSPQGLSKGIIFKDTDDLSTTPRYTSSDNRYSQRSISAECQTSRQGVMQEEIGDIHISQDGNFRTIATNTPKRKIHCLADDVGKLLELDTAEEGEIRCRCIERFLRSTEIPKNTSTTRNNIILCQLETHLTSACQKYDLKSSVSFINNTPQNNLDPRICKSQGTLNKEININSMDSLLNWIHDIFHNDYKRRRWNKKLMKIVKKLNKPNGEVELRKDIESFLMNAIDLCDIRDKDYLVDNIIEIIKNLRVQDKENITRVNLFHVNTSCNKKELLKNIITKWILNLPIKEVDSFGRTVEIDNVTNLATQLLIPKINSINKNSILHLKNNILDALCDIPLDIKLKEKSLFLNKSVNKLIQLLLDAEDEYSIKDAWCSSNTQRDQFCGNDLNLKDFISKKIEHVLDICKPSIEKTHFNYIKLYLANLIITMLTHGKLRREQLTNEIFNIFNGIGHLSIGKINKYTNAILNYLDNVFEGFIEDTSRTNGIDVILNACNSDVSVFRSNTKMRKSNHDLTNLDMNINDLNTCKKLLTDQIIEWLESQCQVPTIQERDFINIAARDLSSSVLARCRFLQCYPKRVSMKAEMEFLKYLIIIWINKTLGYSSKDILTNVNILLNKIIQFQDRFHLKVVKSKELFPEGSSLNNSILIQTNSDNNKNILSGVPIKTDTSEKTSNEEINLANSNNTPVRTAKSLSIINCINSTEYCGFYHHVSSKTKPVPKNISLQTDLEDSIVNPWKLNDIINYNVCVFLNKANPIECRPIQCIYNHYSDILKRHCSELQLDSTMDNGNKEIISNSILNNVWKMYYRLISDPVMEKQNFKNTFEEKFEESLQSTRHLPNFKDVLKMQADWKKTLANLVNEMFERIQETKNGLLFRKSFHEIFYREFRVNIQQHEYLLMRLCDDFVMYSKYKDNEAFKAYIYKQRLMYSIEVLFYNHQNKTQVNLHREYLKNEALKVLEKIKLNDDIINDEANEINLREELDNWLKKLPKKCDAQCCNKLSRYKAMSVLAKNVNIISKIHSDKSLAEQKIEKEVVVFLSTEMQWDIDFAESKVKSFMKRLNLYQYTENCGPACTKIIQTNEKYESKQQSRNNSIHKVESHVRFEDSVSNCSSSNIQCAKPTANKKPGILKDSTKYETDSDVYPSEDSDDDELLDTAQSSPYNTKEFGYKENIRLEDSDDSITIIKNLPSYKSQAFQADLPIDEGTNTEHLFMPYEENLTSDESKPNSNYSYTKSKFFHGQIVADKFSQTSFDYFESNSNEKDILCQKCRSLIEDGESSDEYDDSEEY